MTVKVNSVTPVISTTTASNGTYTLTGVPAGVRTINASRTNYIAADSGDITVNAGATAQAGTLPLNRTTATVAGFVVDVETEDAIEGATITVQEQPGLSATTNASGDYSLTGVRWGTVHLTATASRYTAQTNQVDVPPSGLAYDFYLEIGRGSITGVVVDGTNHTGLSGATVALEDDEGHATGTDWIGNFTLTDVRAGVHNLVVSRGSHATVVTAGVDVVPNQTATAPQVELIPHTATITGRAFNPDTGQPVAGVTVTCARTGQTATTDGAGNYFLSGVAPGWEVLAFTKQGFWPTATGELTVEPGVGVQADGELRPVSGTAPSGLVHGKVLDSLGQPVEGVTVAALGSGSAMTASDGTYSIQLTRGRYVFTATKAGYRTAVNRPQGNGTFYFPYNFQILQDFVLYLASDTGTINLTTTDPLALTPRQGGARIFTLASMYDLDSGPTGARTITEVPSGLFLGWTRPRALPGSQTLSLDFHGPADSPATSPSWAIGGLTFRSTTLEPVGGATVTLSNPGQSFTTNVTTDAHGRWSFASGPTGDYTVTVAADGGLVSAETWGFTAQDDGGIFIADSEMVGSTDRGTLTIDEPAEGATLSSPPSSVTCSTVLPIPGDYIISAEVQLSGGDVTDSVLTFEPDGRHFSISFASSAPDGQHTLSVTALTARDAILTASVTITLQQTASVAALAINPSSVAGGTSAIGTITLDRPAPAGGTIVTLTSSNPTVASVPPTATVPAATTTAQFTVTTFTVASSTQVTISATANGAPKTAQLTVGPLGLQSLTLNPAYVSGGYTSAGTVTLNGPALTGGFAVSLSSSDPTVVTVPASVTVAQGAMSGSFTATTSSPDTTKAVVISAVANGVTKTATLTVTPIGVNLVSLAYFKAGCGATVTGTIYLTSSAPTGGTVVSLTSDNPGAASVPPSVTVPAGQSHTDITVTTYSVASPTVVTISATAGGTTRIATITVGPVELVALTLIPTGMAAGLTSQTNRVELDGAAGTGGVTVSLTSSYGSVSVPTTVTVPVGSGRGEFTLSTWEAVCTAVPTIITATHGSVTKTANFTLQPASLTGAFLSTPTVVAGNSATAYVDLSGWENHEGCPVVLSSSDPTIAFVAGGLGACQPVASFQRCPVDVTTSASAPPGASVTISATLQSHTDTITLTIAAPDISGVAPGLALPGDTVVIYGPTFALNTTVMLQGPYQTSDPFGFSPSCKIPGDVCPTTDLPASVNTEGTAVSFAVPSDLQDGAYHVWTKNPSGTLSNVNRWVIVDTAAKTRAVVPPEEHVLASRIYPGQTITGTLTGDQPAEGVADYNFFYFVGTAGSRINVSMERVDTSKPWEHPDSLDPQIEIFAPDGFLPQNLVAWDDQPGVDLNASLHDAVLPLTGLYVIAAETTRGHGDYRLAFSFSSLAAPAEGARVLAFSGGDRTTTLGTAMSTIVLTLDPRGNPISGANIAYAAHASSDDQGTIGFVQGPYTLSNPDGSSFKDVVVQTAGKIGFDASFLATFTAEPLGLAHQTVQALRVNAPIPRYQPVAKLAYSVGALASNGTIRLNLGAFERLPIERRHLRKDVLRGAANKPASGVGTGGRSFAFGVKSAVIANKTGSGLGPDPGLEPVDASTAVPLPEIQRRMVARSQAITSCSVAQTEVAGVTAQAVNPPYTVTLTDLTPSTGQTEPNGEVGVDGIHGHRVEKIIRLKIQIKDQYGVEPAYPVLVHLAAGGPRHGTIILDPDGTRQECSDATFLWHERDAQGNLVALNEEFEYRMGTWSRYVGVEPDPDNPPQVRPVWGVAEDLEIQLETPDGAPLSYHVHLEPGKPDHFLCLDGTGQQCPDVLPYWAEYLTYIDIQTGRTTAGPFDLFDAYFLKDQFNNTVYGYTDTSATQPAPNVVTEFKDQTQGDGGDFAGYRISTSWDANPSMPAGQLQSTLSLEYPDDPAGDWSAGTVSKSITYDFEGGSSHVLVQKQNYDESMGVDDLPFPLSVPPGANEGSMPTTTAGDTPRLVLLALTGSSVQASVAQGTDEPSLDPNHVYRKNGSDWTYTEVSDPYPTLEVQDTASKVRLSLIDGGGHVVAGTSFRVHPCPRDEHLTEDDPPGECSDAPVDSDALTGVIAEYTLNPLGAQRGYLGIELTQAPVNPGTYFIKVESLGPTTYRIRRQGQLVTDLSIPDGEYQGAFEICVVLGGEILDENFQRVDDLILDRETIVYVRDVEPDESADSYSIEFSTAEVDEEGNETEVGRVAGVQMSRLGRSCVFISEPITIIPAEGTQPASTGPLVARTFATGKTVQGPKTKGRGKAWRGLAVRGKVELSPGISAVFFVDTTASGKSYHSDGSARNPIGGQQPNLLYADGASTTTISVWVFNTRTLEGISAYALTATVPDLVNGALLSGGSPATSASTVTDGNGWAQFTFRAAPLASVPDGTFARATVTLSRTEDPQHKTRASTQVFSYATYDFRDLPFSKADLDPPGPDVGAIQYVFENYVVGQHSFLAHLFFKGVNASAFIDANGSCNFLQADCAYEAGDPIYDPLGTEEYKTGLASMSAAWKFYREATVQGISPFLLVVKAQSEMSLLGSEFLPPTYSDQLTKALGLPASDLFHQIEVAAKTIANRAADTSFHGAPVPPDGACFLASLVVPVAYEDRQQCFRLRQGTGCKKVAGAVKVSFGVADRGDYVAWRYTTWVQSCSQRSGNWNFVAVLPMVRQKFNQAP